MQLKFSVSTADRDHISETAPTYSQRFDCVRRDQPVWKDTGYLAVPLNGIKCNF